MQGQSEAQQQRPLLTSVVMMFGEMYVRIGYLDLK